MYEYKFDREKCWFKDVCGKYKTTDCCASCLRFMEFDFLIYTSRIPKVYQKSVNLKPDSCDYNSFEYLNDLKQDIINFVAAGENLFIHSCFTGNGKTTWATKFLLRYFSEIWLGNGFKPRGLFLSTQNLLFSIKQSFNSANNVQDLLDLIPVVDLVVWDDVAVSGLSAFEQNTLYDFY